MSIKRLKKAFKDKIPLPIISMKLKFPNSFRVYVLQWAHFTNNIILLDYGSFLSGVKDKDKPLLLTAREWIENKKFRELSHKEMNDLFLIYQITKD